MQKRKYTNQEALQRATSGEVNSNYPMIFAGFIEKGIAADDIKPRINVFTYKAWKAKGRQVQRGEHGVKVLTMIDTTDASGEPRKFMKTTTVFHISQTQPING